MLGLICSDEQHAVIGYHYTELKSQVDIEPWTEVFNPYGKEYWRDCPLYHRDDHRMLNAKQLDKLGI